MRHGTMLVLLVVSAMLVSSCVVLGDASPVGLPVGQQLIAATLADTTGSGHDDIIALTDQGLVRLGWCGAGCFQVEQDLNIAFSTTGSLELAAGDVDGDGIDDVVVFANGAFFDSSTFHTFFGSAGAPGRSAGLDPDDTASIDLFNVTGTGLLDFDGDGQADLRTTYVTSFAQTIVWLGDGAGGFADVAATATQPVGFMQYDGQPGLELYRRTCSATCSFVIWDATGVQDTLTLPAGSTAVARDQDGDGIDDVVVSVVPTSGEPTLEVRAAPDRVSRPRRS
ncbi:MAG: hypothetical protein R2695_11345 [Acidimicrobiales bacterium]